jgi:hypothetical protein
VPLTQSSERTGIETKWFSITGRIIALKVEADGDLHIALADNGEFQRIYYAERLCILECSG